MRACYLHRPEFARQRGQGDMQGTSAYPKIWGVDSAHRINLFAVRLRRLLSVEDSHQSRGAHCARISSHPIGEL